MKGLTKKQYSKMRQDEVNNKGVFKRRPKPIVGIYGKELYDKMIELDKQRLDNFYDLVYDIYSKK